MPETAPTVFLDAFGAGGFGSSWRFAGHTGTIETDDPARVAGVLAAVEQATARGEHAVGFVSYEAAHGLNPDLPELPAAAGMPLAWFACYRERFPCTAGEGLPTATTETIPLTPDLAPKRYETAAERVRELIAAGDCYQVNYTFPLAGRFHGAPLDLGGEPLRRRLVPEVGLLAVDLPQLRGELGRQRRGEVGVEGPVLLGLERLDLALALDDEPHRHRLHAPGGEAAAHLLPEVVRRLPLDLQERVDELLVAMNAPARIGPGAGEVEVITFPSMTIGSSRTFTPKPASCFRRTPSRR